MYHNGTIGPRPANIPAPPAVDDGLPAAVARSAHIIREHAIQCTGPGEVTCRGCRDAGWMSWAEYHNHLAVATATAAREGLTTKRCCEGVDEDSRVVTCDELGMPCRTREVSPWSDRIAGDR